MLSQIENDLATPALGTLEYIAERLGVDAGYFLGGENDLFFYKKAARIEGIRELLEKKDYLACLDACEKLGVQDDELRYIAAKCCLELGVSIYSQGMLDRARRYLEHTVGLLESCLYGEELRARAHFYLDIITLIRRKSTNAELPIGGNERRRDLEFDLYCLLTKTIKSGKHELASQMYDTLKIENPYYRKHINALLSAASINYERAVELLFEMVEDFDNLPVSAVFQYTVYSDLEECCKALFDYEGAYNCAIKRGELQTKFYL